MQIFWASFHQYLRPQIEQYQHIARILQKYLVGEGRGGGNLLCMC